MKKVFTLCIAQKGEHVLLGMKKRGFGEGRWNGFGGKVKEGESIEEAMVREMREEAGVIPLSFEKKAVFEFHFKDNPEYLEIHLFCVRAFEGEPAETEEMRPQWFAFKDIPFEAMWPDDKHWFPLFLEGKSLYGKFFFKDQNTISDYDLREVESLL